MVETVKWDGEAIWILDQTKLPLKTTYRRCDTVQAVAESIRDLLVRGAPAIGVTAAFGMVIAAKQAVSSGVSDVSRKIREYADYLNSQRPTAVNLVWATDRMLKFALGIDDEDIVQTLEKHAIKMYDDDIESCKSIGRYGAEIVPDGATILTHCNAGALATAGYGTALGVVRGAVDAGKKVRVFADETRPFLQGARLTTWELQQDNIETVLITDNMAAYFMAKGDIDLVVVGADRIVANGDTANKIGTYSVALAADAHKIPFYVAAPISTIDRTLVNGSLIPIEERDTCEIAFIGDLQIVPDGIEIRYPAFDITPNHLITGIITDRGIVTGDFQKGIAALFS